MDLAPRFSMGDQNSKDDSFFPALFGEDEELPFADFLQVDEDGNLIEAEPELPAHPAQLEDPFAESVQKDQSGDGQIIDDEGLHIHGDEDAPTIFGGDDLQGNNEVQLPSEESLGSEAAEPEPPKRKPRKIKPLAPDSATHINRAEFKNWTDNYLSRSLDSKDVSLQVTAGQAKKNAYHLVFGRGLGDVGLLHGVPGVNHELAEFFSGANLEDLIMGDILESIREDVEKELGGPDRRRSASVAFGSEAGGEVGRRVRPRADEDQQFGHSQQEAQVINEDVVVFDDPELGREDFGSANRRSSNAPWNRPSSAVPSSIRSNKNVEVGRHAVDNSPLVRRGSILQPPSDPKFSGAGLPNFGSDAFAPFYGDGAHDLSSFDEFGVAAGVPTQEANTDQFMREALDREGRNFLEFVERVVGDRGREDSMDKRQRWIDFDRLFDPEDKTRPVVAQAFLHVLTLATKNQIRVKQAGVEEKIPFGDIDLGVTAPLVEVEEQDSDEEMDDVDEE